MQNTVKQERLMFDRLDPATAGVYIQAEGDYTEGNWQPARRKFASVRNSARSARNC